MLQGHNPGELATVRQTLRLAEEYRQAAQLLVQQGRHAQPFSRAPYRLNAIHAIELYLTALLLHFGHKASSIRGMQHSLAERTRLAIAGGLQLRKRTAVHLAEMDGNREYVVTRYGPEMTATVSQINRVTATLEEIAAKVSRLVLLPDQAPVKKTSASASNGKKAR